MRAPSSTALLVLANLCIDQPFCFAQAQHGPAKDPKIKAKYRDACPEYQHYSRFSHRPYSDGPMELPFQRPSQHCRTFESDLVEKIIKDFNETMVDKDLARIFNNAFPNTLDTTVRWHVDGTETHDTYAQQIFSSGSAEAWKGAQSFIVTGDINAEWLRDSTNQLAQYQRLAKKDKAIENLILGAINTQAEYVIESPYCNAFQPPPPSKLHPSDNGQGDNVHPAYQPSQVFECKYELDSLAHFLRLGNEFYDNTGSTEFLTPRWYHALESVLRVLDEQSQSTFSPKTGAFQRQEYRFQRSTNTGTETLNLAGNGNPLNYGTGLIRSAFRPSDDATTLGFFIPGNAMMAVELKRASHILAAAGKPKLSEGLKARGESIEKGVWEHGVVQHAKWGYVFAFEVDGYGSSILMDDANVPSLLALPYLGFVRPEERTYQNTRKMILSKSGNPYYLTGSDFSGIGGPHIGLQNAWPMSLLIQAMTSNDDDEIMGLLEAVKRASPLGLVHESVNVERVKDYTRSWFAWANSVFAQTILDVAERKPHLLFGPGSKAYNVGDTDLTLSCLRSVPLFKDEDALQLAGLKVFLEFQSDLDYYGEQMPPGWIYPAVNLTGSLEELTQKLEDDFYDNEYDFQLDLYKVVSSAYDGHLVYLPDIVGVFQYLRVKDGVDRSSTRSIQSEDLFSLMSVVQGDDELPSVFAYDDLDAMQDEEDAGYTASSIEQINGEDVESWLNSYASQNGRSRDPDANYNSLFQNLPGNGSIAAGGDTFGYSILYQGNETILGFTNGTNRTVSTVAALASNQTLEGVTDGESFFQRFCNITYNEKLQQFAASPANTTTPTTTTQVPYDPVSTQRSAPTNDAFPSPIIASVDGNIAGYFPDDNFEDLAVLSVPSFLSTQARAVEFENAVRQTLATANANNKTKLVIDLRGNGGGSAFLAYDLFLQLFPSQTPYGAGTYRQQQLFNFTGSALSANENLLSTEAGSDELSIGWFPFNYRVALDAQGNAFESWNSLYDGPESETGSPTSLVRHNLTDVSDNAVPILGYGDDAMSQPQTFAAENIVMLTDGTCASTCAVFSEFMKNQAGVKSIAIGGRKQTGPMQAVGGTKGSRLMGMGQLYYIVVIASQYSTPADRLRLLSSFDTDEGNVLSAATKAIDRAAPGSGLMAQASVNFRNNIRQDDDTLTPLQFIYEAADCRFFYTPEMYVRQEAIWERVYQWAWRDEENVCIEGSSGRDSSKNGTSYYGTDLPDNAGNFFGGNNTIFPRDSLSLAAQNGTQTTSGVSTSGTSTGSSGESSQDGSDGGNGGDSENGASVLFASRAVGLVAALLMGCVLVL
ncbi:glycoside hydrolase family 125 protein [Hortaea werneckii]|nr:glycoside hydrolase family 125 protein [Hortaea werneckii]KAI7623148.1 glycoside hydrolase family 125 protein [Hortaea werneckii]KAI7633709.1 glycoside hydrolase family 125 protein [Hortaea werneckii]